MYLPVMFLTRIFAIYIRPFFLHNKKTNFLPNLIFSVLKTSQKLKEFLHFFYQVLYNDMNRFQKCSGISIQDLFLMKVNFNSNPMLKFPIVTGIVPYWRCFFLKMLLISLPWNESEKIFLNVLFHTLNKIEYYIWNYDCSIRYKFKNHDMFKDFF